MQMMTTILGSTKETRERDLMKRRKGKLKRETAKAPGRAMTIERIADKKAWPAENCRVLRSPLMTGPAAGQGCVPIDRKALTANPPRGKKKNTPNSRATAASTVKLELLPPGFLRVDASDLPRRAATLPVCQPQDARPYSLFRLPPLPQ